METPKKVQKILKKLKKTDAELAEQCISQATATLRENGYSDARLWATKLLYAMIGDLGYVESMADMDSLMLELEGMEQDVFSSVYDTFTDIYENVKDSEAEDVRDTLVYSLSKTLDSMDKEKYKRLYG